LTKFQNDYDTLNEIAELRQNFKMTMVMPYQKAPFGPLIHYVWLIIMINDSMWKMLLTYFKNIEAIFELLNFDRSKSGSKRSWWKSRIFSKLPNKALLISGLSLCSDSLLPPSVTLWWCHVWLVSCKEIIPFLCPLNVAGMSFLSISGK